MCGTALMLPLLVIAGMAFPQAEPPAAAEKHPEPTEETVKRIREEIRGLFKAKYADRSSEARKTLAAQFLQYGQNRDEKPETRYVLLREAIDLATETSDVQTALEAVDEIVRDFAVDGVVLREKVLSEVRVSSQDPETAQQVAEAYAVLVEEAIVADDYDTASRAVYKAKSAARSTKDSALMDRMEALSKELTALRTEYNDVRKHHATLKKHPDDPEANSAYGAYLCLVKGDWDRGLPLLAKGSDTMLKGMAEREAAGGDDLKAVMALGDGWWDLAEKRKATEKQLVLERAGFWYEKARAGEVYGLDRIKVEKRLGELAKMERAVGAGLMNSSLPRGVVAIYTFDKATIASDGKASIARDLSGRSGPAKLIGGSFVPGVAGQAFLTASSKAYVDLGLRHDPTPKTICFWAKSATAGVTSQLIFGYIARPPANRFYVGYDRKGVLSLGLAGSGWGAESGDVRLDTEWHHYAIVYDGAKMGLYLDGKHCCVKQGSVQEGGRYFIGTLCSAGEPYGTGFRGAVDEFIMFGRVLSLQEITRVFHLGARGKSLKR